MTNLLQDFKFEIATHRGKNVIWIDFPYSEENVRILSRFCKPRFSYTAKRWYTPYTKASLEFFGLEKNYLHAIQKIHPVNRKTFSNYIDHLKLKSYSPKTIDNYRTEFSTFLKFIDNQPAETVTPDELQAYFLYCVTQDKLSETAINSRINAVKYYYEKILKNERMFFDIPRPKKPLQLPKTLNKKEIKSLFEVTENLKHRTILKLCYGMGLRVSEIVNLKIADINSQNMVVRIERGKGKKDRFVGLPESILQELRTYYLIYKPQYFLFEGNQKNAMSVRSIQMIFKNAMQKAKIQKKVGIHSLRHSYATHLLELGTDISHIQKLLGHNRIATTLAYTHVTNKTLHTVISPLDKL